MNTANATRHLDEGELMRYVDGEGSPTERTVWERHLAGCDRCAADIDAVGSESRLLSGWLDRADFEADLPSDLTAPGAAPAVASDDAAVISLDGRRPAGRRDARHRSGWSPWLRAAAALVLLAGPLAAIPAVRTWVIERVSPAETSPSAALADPEATQPSPVIRFLPDPGTFTVRVEAPAGGQLAIGRSTGEEAQLRLSGDGPDPVVAASSVRLQSTAADGRYALLLPVSVTTVEVVIGGVRRAIVDGADIEAGRVVRLDSGPR